MDKERGTRLFKLRKKKKLTQSELYDELQKIIAKNEGTTVFATENGKQAICKIESGDSLSLRNALAYADFFNVSLDYIYRGTESYKPEYDIVKNTLGLSDDAIHKLEELNNKSNNNIIYVLNELLDPSRADYFIELLQAFFDYRYVGYEPNDVEYLSLFKINEIAKKIAYEFKDIGCRPWK